jgi:hypothetical protein
MDRIRNVLGALSIRLGDADWLDGAFSAGDLMMVSVLLRLREPGLRDEFPNVAAYVASFECWITGDSWRQPSSWLHLHLDGRWSAMFQRVLPRLCCPFAVMQTS